VTTVEEKWREKPPSVATVWLLNVVTVLAFAAAIITPSWWKAFAGGAGILCATVAWLAWSARYQARSSDSS
jgi:hypothetical protein